MKTPDERGGSSKQEADQQQAMPRRHNHISVSDMRAWVHSLASQQAPDVSDDEAAWARSMSSQQAKQGR